MNTYSVNKQSELGVQFAAYIEKCNEKKQRAKDFVCSLTKWFPEVFCTEHTIIEQPTDSEAGGVMYISVPEEIYNLYENKIDRQIWEIIRMDGWVDIFPRIVTETHYIRHDRAVKLHRNSTPDWKFRLDENGDVAYTTYEKVRRKLSDFDRRALCGKLKEPKPTLKVALGRRYFFLKEEDDLEQKNPVPAPRKDTRAFALAIEVYDAFNSLPIVPIGTAGRLLQLHLPAKAQKASREEIAKMDEMHWEEKETEYIFRTPLESSHPDMQPCI